MQAGAQVRSVLDAWRQCSPVRTDAPLEVRRYLIERYLQVAVGNVRRGILAWLAMLAIVAYQAPALPRAVAAVFFAALVGARWWRARLIRAHFDPANPSSDRINDGLMLAAAMCWGAAPFVLAPMLPESSGHAVAYVSVVAIGVVAVSFVSALPASIAEVLFGMLPVTAFYFSRGTVLGLGLGVATLSFASALIVWVTIGHDALLRALLSERENARLLEELEQYRRLLERENAALDNSLRHASDAANHDPLTGVLNRRYLDSITPALAELARAGRESVSLCVIDIDHFKQVNDVYGHTVGDKVLKTVAELIGARLREADCLVRVGGEEFVAILRSCGLTRGEAVAGALRRTVETNSVRHEGGAIRVTVSIGLAQWRTDEPFDEVFKRADRMLYLAKQQGRNRVEVEPAPLLTQ